MICQTCKTIGIYVLEEQELYQQIYRHSFEIDGEFDFLGISSIRDKHEIQKVLTSKQPDVLLLGIKKVDEDLFTILENICSEHPKVRLAILMTTINADGAKLLRKLIQKCRRGIAIYMKQSLDNPKQLHDIIFSVIRGQVILDPSVTTSILMERKEYPSMKLLTERELEILKLLSLGHTNLGIANTLCIDSKTVAHHLNNLYSKLKDDNELDQMHPRVSVARLYLETTGELMPSDTNITMPNLPSASN